MLSTSGACWEKEIESPPLYCWVGRLMETRGIMSNPVGVRMAPPGIVCEHSPIDHGVIAAWPDFEV